MALRVTRIEAETTARGWPRHHRPFWATGESLDAGHITFAKAWVIADCLGDVALPVALPIEARPGTGPGAHVRGVCGATSSGC